MTPLGSDLSDLSDKSDPSGIKKRRICVPPL